MVGFDSGHPDQAPLSYTNIKPPPPPRRPTPLFPPSQVVGFDSGAGKKFKFEGEPTAEAIVQFGEAVVAGTAPKFFKSGEC